MLFFFLLFRTFVTSIRAMVVDNFILTEQCDLLLNDIVAYYTELYRTKQNPEFLAEAKKFAALSRDHRLFASREKMEETIAKYKNIVN